MRTPIETAAIVALLPHLGADAEVDAGRHTWRQAHGQRVVPVESQGEGAQPGLEKEDVGIGGQVIGERHPLAVDEAQVLDVGRAEAIGVQAGLDGRQPLGKFDVEAIAIGFFEHQQPRAPVAEGHAGDVDAVLE